VKQHHWAGLSRTLVKEGNNVTTFWKKLFAVNTLIGMSYSWFLVKPVALVEFLRKFVSALLEDDFQGFFNKDVNRSEISNLMSVLKGFENISDENLEEWLINDVCEGGFQYITDAVVSAATE
jgi:hypothetical protein